MSLRAGKYIKDFSCIQFMTFKDLQTPADVNSQCCRLKHAETSSLQSAVLRLTGAEWQRPLLARRELQFLVLKFGFRVKPDKKNEKTLIS